jgi:hypothetical protein
VRKLKYFGLKVNNAGTAEKRGRAQLDGYLHSAKEKPLTAKFAAEVALVKSIN